LYSCRFRSLSYRKSVSGNELSGGWGSGGVGLTCRDIAPCSTYRTRIVQKAFFGAGAASATHPAPSPPIIKPSVGLLKLFSLLFAHAAHSAKTRNHLLLHRIPPGRMST